MGYYDTKYAYALDKLLYVEISKKVLFEGETNGVEH
jgi:hypothetical protein